MSGWHLRSWLFSVDEDGVTAIEYALIGSLIAVVCIAGMLLAGDALGTLWSRVGDCMTSFGRNCS